MKRICIFSQTWESGGIEAFLTNILLHMDLSNLEIDIVIEKQKESIFTEKLIERGVVFRELTGSTRKVFQNYRLFSEMMNQRKYDVLHLNVFQALPLIYLLLAKQKGISIRIAHSHNTMLRKSKLRGLKMAIHVAAKWAFAKDATDMWACSHNAAKFMFPFNLLEERGYRFIPNGIDLKRFSFNAEERKTQRKKLHLEDAFVVGNIGRLCYQKNQSFLLDVFWRVHMTNPSARLLLVGEGEALLALQTKAKRLGISDEVIFYGTSNEVEKLLWVMDVFAFPSVFEGLGIVAIEAQAAGLPLICSDQVPEEAIVSKCAYRLPLNNSNIWVSALAQIYRDGRINPSENKELDKFDSRRVSYWVEETYLH